MKRTVPLALLAVALAADGASPCAMPVLVDRPLTADGAVIPSSGGVVIEVGTASGPDYVDDAMRGARLLAGTDRVEVTYENIAPGLTVLVPKPQPNRTIDLVAVRDKKVLSFVQGEVAPKHTAPLLVQVSSTLAPPKPVETKRKGKGKGKRKRMPPPPQWPPSSQYMVDLAQAPPDDVLALVVHVDGQGVAYAKPRKGQTSYSFDGGGKRCAPGPAPIMQGSSVSIAWLDKTGRLSVESRTVKVGVTKEDK